MVKYQLITHVLRLTEGPEEGKILVILLQCFGAGLSVSRMVKPS
jgi:hypothetical protein